MGRADETALNLGVAQSRNELRALTTQESHGFSRGSVNTLSSAKSMEPSIASDHLVTDKLSDVLQACAQAQFTKGRLDVKATTGQQWSLYFELGHLVGDAGGVHPVRRWCRQLSRYCPQLGVDAVTIQGAKVDRYWNYDFLAKLVRQKEILREQMVAVVEGSIAEVLFDILQQEELVRGH